ncbi:MAG: tRNA (adenosine(37)-N6)-dimethylallyltransferase MiaA [Pseudomonadales bacterium]|nr:tRNA (adenosine(37)-N6)-dimethylallyltransferase MiaA [Pseudomonadales bacterium]
MAGRVILLLGPTAAGKTATAMKLFDALGGTQHVALVSVDSALVYRGLDIGTAKPTADELTAYPHSLINVRDPADPYTVADFVSDADLEVAGAVAEDKTVVLVGGTMLYAKRFIEGIAELPRADPELRQQLRAQLEEKGNAALWAELEHRDAVAAREIHPNNPQRLLRALEVIRMTGQPISELWRKQSGASATERLGAVVQTFGIMPPDRARLHERITRRLEEMLALGFLGEVEGLKNRDDLHLDLPSMRAVGYRQAWQHLAGVLTYGEFVADAATATRRLAKRQMTWLRQWQDLIPIESEAPEQIASVVVEQLGKR